MKDHCTKFPDHLFGIDISECCEYHDICYALGGGEQERFLSDIVLKRCVFNKFMKKKVNFAGDHWSAWFLWWYVFMTLFVYSTKAGRWIAGKIVSNLMFAGVRLFGKKYFNYHSQ